MKIDNNNGWTEAVISEQGSIEEFFKIAGLLQATMGISLENRVSETDSIYWDFTYNGRALTLHQNTFSGISIFPVSLNRAIELENEAVLHLFKSFSRILEKYRTTGNFISKYFEPEPNQWGLRGDPHLWRHMKLELASQEIPSSVAEFENLLLHQFEKLTGQKPQKGGIIYSRKYGPAGMSRGKLCSEFWLEKGFPLLVKRFKEDATK